MVRLASGFVAVRGSSNITDPQHDLYPWDLPGVRMNPARVGWSLPGPERAPQAAPRRRPRCTGTVAKSVAGRTENIYLDKI